MPSPLINVERLGRLIDELDLAAVVAVSPENTYYLSSVFIRTQVTIRDRIAVVVWPREAEPSFLVCNIEESLARKEGSIDDIRTYVEFAESPIRSLAGLIQERGLAGERLGVEMRYISAQQMEQLVELLPDSQLVSIDEAMDQVRAVKTPAEIERIVAAYRLTEEGIRRAWSAPSEGVSERLVANRMGQAFFELGSEGLRHMTLSSGENTVHPHMSPGERRLGPGDTVLTDVGAYWDGFASDMARMGIVGAPTEQQRREYSIYREAYVRLLHAVRPGIQAAELYRQVLAEMRDAGYDLALPHVGHGVSRRGGHEFPMLQPRNEALLEPGMVLAIEPGFKPRPNQRYHLEDLVVVTHNGAEIITDWRSTESLFAMGAAGQ